MRVQGDSGQRGLHHDSFNWVSLFKDLGRSVTGSGFMLDGTSRPHCIPFLKDFKSTPIASAVH